MISTHTCRMMTQTIRIELQHAGQTGVRAWMSAAMSPLDDVEPHHPPALDLNIDAARGFTGALSAAVMQVLRSEIQAGFLMGCKGNNRTYGI